MFTGIIETLGKVIKLEKDSGNLNIHIQSALSQQLKVDQSIAHNGVCLTVTTVNNDSYAVTAIKETLDKTNMSNLKIGDTVNLERAMKLGERLDGHIVQGHVDEVGVCTKKIKEDGSHVFTFKFNSASPNITIEKGSITVNGVSLTVVNSKEKEFSVAIIPYTFEHTNFKEMQIGDVVNLEFDVVGKYVLKLVGAYSQSFLKA